MRLSQIIYGGIVLLALAVPVSAKFQLGGFYLPSQIVTAIGSESDDSFRLAYKTDQTVGWSIAWSDPFSNPFDPNRVIEKYDDAYMLYQLGMGSTVPRRVRQGDFISNGVSSIEGTTGLNSKLSVDWAFFNLLVNFDERRYLIYGVNYSMPSWSQESLTNEALDLSGELGYQVGYGYRWGPSLFVEIMYHWFNYGIQGEGTRDYKRFSEQSLLMGLKYEL
ncbi:hypothetical protein HOH87_00555 [bacterium]|jgi:hypothetical protein|nr:hypothetical protein [bacterium]